LITLLIALTAATADCPVQLTDAAKQAGIAFQHERGGTKEHRLPESMGSGVAWLDYDNDGWMDLYVVQSGPFPPNGSPQASDRLFRNNGNGTFSDVTAKAGIADKAYGMGAFAADYGNDGFVDVFVTNWNSVNLYRNQGNGTFRDTTAKLGLSAKGWFSAAAWADVDGDNLLDLALTRYVDDSQEAKLFCGNVETGERMYCRPMQYPGTTGFLFRNAGDGSFRDITREAGMAEAVGKALGAVFVDVDMDGKLDLYVANDALMNFLFRNLGGGKFEDISVISGTAFDPKGNPQGSMGVDAGDLDGDGKPDLAMTNFEGEPNAYYHNLGSGLFEDLSVGSGFAQRPPRDVGFGLSFLDLESDGDLDIFVANGHVDDRPRLQGAAYAQRNALHWNQGGGRFVERPCGSAFEKAYVGRGSAVADYDNDGDSDIAVSNSGGPLLLLRNDGRQGGWLGVQLVGRKSNRHGIGARLVAETPAGKALTRIVLAGSSYYSTADPRVLFGLGSEKAVKKLTIYWPSGTVQTLENLPAGKYVKVEETASR
jgi:hypothetical protein